jgi:site-specific recombinase XerD
MGATKVRNLIQASEAHLADCRFRNLSGRTLELYGYIEEDFLKYLRHEELPLAMHALNAENVRGWASWHLEHAHGRGKRDGESVIRTGVGILKTWSRWMVNEDLLEADYTARVKRPKTTRTARQPYEAWELQALRGAMAETITGTRDVAMLTLLIDTGVRVHELMSLRLDDLDLNARRLKVVWGKGRKERYLPFGSSDERDGGRSVRRLREYLKIRRVSPRCPEANADLLWMTYDGLPFTQGGFQGHFRKLARRAGLTHTEVHATRHTFAVNYLVRASLRGNHNPVEELRYLLGHLSEDTYRIYIGQAGQIIAEIEGSQSISDQLLDGQNISRLRPGVHARSGAGTPVTKPGAVLDRSSQARRSTAK